jgi:transcriptional regulator
LLGLSPAEAQILTWRLGWSGPPRTRVEIARALGTTDAAVARLERRLLLMRSTTATPGPCPAR